MVTTYLDRKPVLAGERILCSLLEALLAFGKTFIPSYIFSILHFHSGATTRTDFPTAMIVVSVTNFGRVDVGDLPSPLIVVEQCARTLASATLRTLSWLDFKRALEYQFLALP